MAERIRRSSGNVFKDVGFPPEEAAHLLIRTDLMLQIERVLKERGLTQAKAAKLLGVTQPRVSVLVRGRVVRPRRRGSRTPVAGLERCLVRKPWNGAIAASARVNCGKRRADLASSQSLQSGSS
jgi:predicted XRE-type DNA-binding protein